MNWISVNEQLPEELEIVNAYNVGLNLPYPEMYYDEGKWFDMNEVENAMYDAAPTHWCKKGKMPKFPTK